MGIISHTVGDQLTLILDEEESRKLAALRLKASAAQQEIILFLREVARKKGITSATLEGLSSGSGKPFVEIATKVPCSSDYGRAVVMMGNLSPGLSQLEIETAYFCHSPYLRKDPDNCGWVKGIPASEKYDNIGTLSGSAGIRYFCRICGKLIGEHIMTRS